MVIVQSHNWWVLVLRGVCAVLFGIGAIAWPGITLGVMVLFYGAFALVDGVFSIAAALVGRGGGSPWWAMLLRGLVGIAVGIITFAWLPIAELALLYTIAAWAVATGILEIAAAIRLRTEIRGEWMLVLSGALSVLLGILLAARPVVGLLWIVYMTGGFAIVYGVMLIALGVRLRRSVEVRIEPGTLAGASG